MMRRPRPAAPSNGPPPPRRRPSRACLIYWARACTILSPKNRRTERRDSRKWIETMALTLRPVEKDDEAFLFSLYSAVRMEEVAEWGWSESQQEAFLRMQFDGQQAGYKKAYAGASHSIILSEGEPIGRLFVGARDGALRLVDISILPEHRGAGSGTSLIRD